MGRLWTPGTLERAGNFGIVVAAIILSASYVSDRYQLGRTPVAKPTVPANWRVETTTGISLGPMDAPINIVEFMDLQCPGCALWAKRLDALVNEFPDLVSVTWHHFPIESIHPHAVPAAIAAECAERQGRFYDYVKVLLEGQATLALRDWRVLAEGSLVPDLDEFHRCTELPVDSFPRIAYGKALGEANGVRATPTVWVNGVAGVPSLEALRELALSAEPRSLAAPR